MSTQNISPNTNVKKRYVTIDGLAPNIVAMEINETLFGLLPTIHLTILAQQGFANGTDYLRRMKSIIEVTIDSNKPSFDEEVGMFDEDKFQFLLQDYKMKFNPKTSESIIEIFGTLKTINDSLWNNVKHKSFKGKTSDILNDIINFSNQKTTIDCETNDNQLQIQFGETDFQFIQRLIQQSYISDSDVMVVYSTRNGEVVVTSTENINSSSPIYFDSRIADLENISNGIGGVEEFTQDKSKMNVHLPLSNFEYIHTQSNAFANGVSGFYHNVFDQNVNGSHIEFCGFPMFSKNNSGNVLPMVVKEWGNIIMYNISPLNDNNHKNYTKAKWLNNSYWSIVTNNRIRFNTSYFSKLQLGKTFKVSMDIEINSDDDRVESDFLKNAIFTIHSLKHFWKDDKIWTEVQGTRLKYE